MIVYVQVPLGTPVSVQDVVVMSPLQLALTETAPGAPDLYRCTVYPSTCVPLGNTLAFHTSVTLFPEARGVGLFPAGIVSATLSP